MLYAVELSVEVQIVDLPEPRNRLSVALRLLLAIPHFLVLFFVLLAWC